MAADAIPAAAPLLAVVGPTASGKTELAIEVAERLGAEIVCADSTTVYRGMDVGTAKATPEQRARVPHHLIDVAEPSEPFTVARYQRLARAAIEDVRGRGRVALLVGGSGLYVRAVADDLVFPPTDPAVRERLQAEAAAAGATAMYERLAGLDLPAADRIEPDNVRRTVRALEVAEITGRPFSSYAEAWDRYPPDRVRAVGVDVPRPDLYTRIEARVRAQLAEGLVEEVKELAHRGLAGWLTASQAIGYAEFARHLEGELSLDEAVARTVKRTKALARRQLAWFRRDPRIRWFAHDEPALAEVVGGYLRGRASSPRSTT
ncbi:MAG TPA: tRNA (adenosine(37)-N6)-dimethylallyltransferase MiaA [Actinomycetota bacterium]|nr:tRNA (adenosine(37)-N6)-dimethylallyltransferase MiaA [Actinomycetota bacterium]